MSFDPGSAHRLSQAHHLLQLLMNEAIKKTPFMILDSQRGRHAQEQAFAQGHSKVHFGNSAHNWSPSVALDVAPLPLDWHNARAFMDLGLGVIMPLAHALHIPIRWGADFNRDGNYTNDSFVDMPHYELFPWREFAKECKPFEG